MTDSQEKLAEALRASLKETRRLREQNRRLVAASVEPVAVVGVGCRFPGGAGSAEQLWDLVAGGVDAVGEFPADRGWDAEDASGSFARVGGFVYEATGFDPGFFGISPREALAMDPQQRLLLECAWEALEDAGVDPMTLRGSQTGVFTGVISQDYGPRSSEASKGVEGFVLTGTIASVASGRVAYVLGLEGPAVSVDTACSSSLVALHLAVQSLRRGECSMALAGGATVMATPDAFGEFSRVGGLAPDGRCKAFAAGADGTGWGEGAGLLVVERLSDAIRNGHRVLGLVVGSAVNQDGASNGLTAPNGPSQERVIRAALADAGLSTADVDAVEGHGTGTTLGDPIEAGALLATYGQGRTEDEPLLLGSVKSNIGHTQAAAGVAGVIKVLMAIRHQQMPATLHVDEPSPHVDWGTGHVCVLTHARDWSRQPGRTRRVGVSAFGISGTNAHVIIAEPPAAESAEQTAAVPSELPGVGGVLAWPVSAKTEAALAAQAVRIADHVRARPGLEPAEVAAGLAARSVFAHRAVVTGQDRAGLLAGLEAIAAGESAPNAITGTGTAAGPGPGKAVFVFPGQGGQWAGMGADLLDRCPVFADEVAACEQVLEPLLGWRVSDVLRDAPGSPALERPDVVQPALFTIMTALARVWRWLGIEPAAVAGHSQGEIAAAYVAGILSLEDAARVVAARGKALAALAGTGAMAAVRAPEQQAAGLAARWPGLAVAAVNGPSSVVISGLAEHVAELVEVCSENGVRARLLAVDYASHSAQVEPVRRELAAALAGISPRPGMVPFWSGLTGQVADGTTLDGQYWYDSLRGQVRFEEVVRGLAGAGYGTFIEASPHPVLIVPVQEILDDTGTGVVTGTLRRDCDGPRQLLAAAATVFTAGTPVNWPALCPGIPRAELPGYAFQRQQYWLTAGRENVAGAGLEDAGGHPLLGAAVELADGQGWVLTGRLSVAAQPWLAEHVVHGVPVLPGVAFAELAWHAGTLAGCAVLEELIVLAPLAIPGASTAQVQVIIGPPDQAGRRSVTISARPAGTGQEWTRHAEGTTSPVPGPADVDGAEAWPPPGAVPVPLTDGYERLAEAGYQYGPAFRAVTAAWRRNAEVFAEVTLPDGMNGTGFGLHPVLLDAALHAALLTGLGGTEAVAPFAWSEVALIPETAAGVLRVRLVPAGAEAVSVVLTNEAGQVTGRIGSVRSRPVTAAQLTPAGELLALEWVPVPVPGEQPGGDWVVAGPDPLGLSGLLGARYAGSYQDLDELAAAVAGGAPVPAVVAVTAATAEACSAQLRQWLSWAAGEAARLVVATRGAIEVPGDFAVDDAGALAGAAAWGLVRSAQAAEPGRFVLADIDGSADVLPGAVASGEPQLAIRAGQVLAARLARLRPADAPAVVLCDTVLVTGGTGTLGSVVARHLVVRHGVTELVLASRRGTGAPGAARLAAELAGLGASVRVVACDVTVREAVAGLVAWAGPLAGVVHVASAAGAAGARHLHELTAGMDLTAFVLFSSVAGLLGTAPEDDAAASAVLCRLAWRRHEQGLPGLSLVWGPFDDLARSMDLFDAGLAGNRPMVVAARIDSAALARSGQVPALLRGLVRGPVRAAAATDPGGLAARLAGLDAARQDDLILRLVRGQAAAVLGHAGIDAVEPQTAFRDMGLDSPTAVQLRNRLAHATGLRLPATMAFDYPSPAALARYLLGRVAPGAAARAATAPAMVRGTDSEPIAVVGIGCRFPGGAASAEGLWDVVAGGLDVVGGFPADRGWDAEDAGGSFARQGGFVYDAAEFDAAFFGISPREALAMDPQQRLLLECSWEALEDAGLDPVALRGTQAGVFTGYQAQDYGKGNSHNGIEGHLLTGTIASVGSGRVAYVLGLEGPALSVDTACSSALVALHLAVQSLRRGECSLALAGAATVMATPRVFTEFARQGGLAGDGRCKAYSSAADGTGFAEGAGVLVVERLSDAVRNGHRVLGVVAGSAVNQDGASNGLTAPNGPSQERVIRAALADAGIGTADVDVVEGHGTGTVLGDPIEAGALLATYGQGRGDGEPLWLGSVKSNIGHAQTSAGVAGVIKVLMALRHGELPRTLHVGEASPHVDWDSGRVALLTAARAWPRVPGRVRRAGVSSFGMSGTNAHVIIAEPPVPGPAELPAVPERPAVAGVGGVVAWVVSGKTEGGLAGQAARIAEYVRSRPGLDVAGVAAGLAGRSVFPYRAVVTGADAAELVAGLAAVAAGEPAPGVAAGVAGPGAGKVVLVFPGQGGQWAGMGGGLLDCCPVFAGEVAACERVLEPLLGWRVSDVLRGAAGAPVLERPDVVQPALFTVMAGLARVWRWLGVEPAAVAGHSQGEIAAAYVAGVLSLEDAGRVVAARGKALAALAGTGAMATVRVPEGQAAVLAGRWPGLAVAAVNSASSVVISGPGGAVAELVAACEADGVRARLLAVDYASHSAQVELVREELAAALAGISPRRGTVPFWSGLTGEVIEGTALGGAYWYDSLRGQVRFQAVVRGLARAGYGVFVEASPHPVLAVPVQEVLDEAGAAGVVTGTLRRGGGGPRQLLAAAAEVHVRGGRVDWPVLWPGAVRAELPGYAFQRDRYWLAAGAGTGDVAGAGLQDAGGHPLLGAAVELAGGQGWVLAGRISVAAQPWLADHVVHQMAVLPGAAFAELAWYAGSLAGCGVLEELTVLAPLVFPGTGAVQVQVMVGPPDGEGRRLVTISGRPAGSGQEWVRHAEGTAGPGQPAAGGAEAWAQAWPPAGAVPADGAELYQRLAGAGYEYGPAFRAVTSAWRRGDELFAEITRPDQVDPAGFALHPVLLDASMHAAGLGALGEPGEDGEVLVPFAWSGVVLVPGAAGGVLRVRLVPAGADGVSVTVLDAAGQLAARVGAVRSRPVSAAALAAASSSSGGGLLGVDWVPGQVPVPGQGLVPGEGAGVVWVVAGPDPLGVAGLLGGWCGGSYPGLAELAAAVEAGVPVPPVVAVTAGAAAAAGAMTGAVAGGGRAAGDVPGVVGDACAGVLGVLQWWLGWEPGAGSVLVVVTRGAVAAGPGDQVSDLAGAAAWGLVRSAQTEEPGRFVLADIGTVPGPASALPGVLAGVVAAGEPQVAVRAGQLLVPRLGRPAAGLAVPAGLVPWRLAVGRPGTPDGLVLAAYPDAAGPLGAGQVRVAVRAGGVNFRDVLIMLGMYPGQDLVIGNEAAGLVTGTGPGVSGLVAGDAVMGVLPGGTGPAAVTDQRLLAKIPAGWSFAQAAAVPVAFLTAWYGLADLAGLTAGETVLIHSGAGGVGMAAVQVARHLGARVLATASPGKHHVLAGLGLDPACIASSRSTGFEEQFREVTGGRGVDVVLNCLAGEFTDASLRLLAPGGRFIEMGKTDLRDPARALAGCPGGRYEAFDLMADAGPDRISQILTVLTGLFGDGTLTPLPVTAWDVRQAPAAFRYMSQARHAGKIALTIPPAPAVLHGPVLVTGGTGTLGALITRHLATAHHAADLVLASRRGPAAPGTAHLAADLATHGVTVRVVAGDVSDRAAAAGLLAWTGRLAGVVHLAGVLDDGPIGSLTAQRVRAVLRAKADAAWHLHELTAGMDLAMFVMFSSAAGILGSPGQGNYAAANAYLDALAQWRRQQGLPGVSLAWGLWEQASGMTGHLGQADFARMRRGGVVPMGSEQGLELFDAGLSATEPAVVTALIDDRALGAQARSGDLPPLLRGLIRSPVGRIAGKTATAEPGGLAGRLAGLDADGRREAVLQVVRAQAAAVLGHDGPDAVEPGTAFRDIGFDSLTAVELRNRLANTTGLRLPATVIFDYPSPAALAAHLCGLLLPSKPVQEAALPDVFTDIEKWDAALPEIRDDDNFRAKLTERLRSFLDKLEADDVESAEALVGTATVDEVYDYIENQLGISYPG